MDDLWKPWRVARVSGATRPQVQLIFLSFSAATPAGWETWGQTGKPGDLSPRFPHVSPHFLSPRFHLPQNLSFWQKSGVQ